MRKAKFGIVAALGLGALAGCAARETNAEEPAQNSYTVVRVDEQTGTRVEMNQEGYSIERGNISYNFGDFSRTNNVSYLNSANERVEISAYPPENYDSLPPCFEMLVSVDGIYKWADYNEPLCNAASQRWIEVCKELRCLEAIQEWHVYRKDLIRTITPERLQ